MLFKFAKLSGLLLRRVVAAALPYGFISFAEAVPVITSPGSLMDLGAGWRTSSVSKDGLDLDGNGVPGNDGYWTFGANASMLQPSYASGVAITGSVYPGNGSYAQIDNPSTTPGPSPTTYTSGTLNPFVNGAYADVSFTVSGNVPGLIRVGLMIDNLDIAGYNPSALQIVDATDGVSSPLIATTSAEFNDRIPDWVFFDISGGSAGEVFDVDVYSGPNGCNCLGAVSFDSASGNASIPEPTSVALLGFALASLLVAARRRTT
jgi:hypothetical protein